MNLPLISEQDDKDKQSSQLFIRSLKFESFKKKHLAANPGIAEMHDITPFEQEKPKNKEESRLDIQARNLRNNRIVNLFSDDGVPYWVKKEAFLDFTRSQASKGKLDKWKLGRRFFLLNLEKNLGNVTRPQIREGEVVLVSENDFRVFMMAYDFIPESRGPSNSFDTTQKMKIYFNPLDFTIGDNSPKFVDMENKTLTYGRSTPFSDEHEMRAFKSEPLLVYWEAVYFFLKVENNPRNYISESDLENDQFFRFYNKTEWDRDAFSFLSRIIKGKTPA